MNTQNRFSVYQDGGPILGSGDTQAAAWADCKKWSGNDDLENDPHFGQMHEATEYQGVGCLPDRRTDQSNPDRYEVVGGNIVDPRRECNWCGQKFTPQESWQEYCSDDCFTIDHC